MENVNSTSKSAIQAGAILGLVSVVLTFVFYFVDAELLTSWKYSVPSLVISLGLLFYFGRQFRNVEGGFLSFGKAFNFSFIALVVSTLISTIGLFLLMNVVDPNLPTVLADTMAETMVDTMEKFGQNMTVDQIEEMKKGMLDAYTPFGMLKAFGINLFLSAIFALILGAILKKNDPSLDY
jgi:hypothetical protein